MFRELSRKKQQLTKSECERILTQQKRGVLSVMGDDGYPYGMPMNHYYDIADGCIYFHSGKKGHRTDAIGRCAKASFCVYDDGVQKEGHWALQIKSVIAFGKVEMLTDEQTIRDIAYKLCLKFTSDQRYINDEIERFASSTVILKLIPEHICGKTVEEQ